MITAGGTLVLLPYLSQQSIALNLNHGSTFTIVSISINTKEIVLLAVLVITAMGLSIRRMRATSVRFRSSTTAYDDRSILLFDRYDEYLVLPIRSKRSTFRGRERT